MTISIGTAGWSIPRQVASEFPEEGTSLARYAAQFPVAEINSSFHRPHRPSTWQRWHDSVPADFRFSVKLPKPITHEMKLVDAGGAVRAFVEQSSPLGSKLAIYLVQLPPRLPFEEPTAAQFFSELSAVTQAMLACEPRHPSWFTPEADAMLQRFEIARVAADPAICDAAAIPGGWRGLEYWRLHGSPTKYRSSYQDRIGLYASRLKQGAVAGHEVWCIFDNTASSAAAGDALALMRAVEGA